MSIREKKINNAAFQAFGKPEQEELRQAFIKGVNWAEYNPSDCFWKSYPAKEWIRDALKIDVNKRYADAFVDELCKFMEGIR